MSYLTITYNIKPGTTKTTYLINPKGFSVKNNFSKKLLTGKVSTNTDKTKFILEYTRLNPSFPIASYYVSDSNGNKISTVATPVQTVQATVTPQQTQEPIKIVQDTIPEPTVVLNVPGITKEKDSTSPMILGLVLVGLGYFIFKD